MSSGRSEKRRPRGAAGASVAAGARPAANGKRHRRFLRRVDARLTAWFSLVLVVMAMALFGFTTWNVYRTLRLEDEMALTSRMLRHWAPFSSAVSEESAINGLINDVQSETMAIGDRPYFIRIATRDNQEVFSRIPMIEWQLAFDFTPLYESATPHSEGFLTLPSAILGYELEVLGQPISENYVLQIGMDTETRTRVVALYQKSFLFTFGILFGISVLGGLFFVSRSLRPIGALSSTIASIIETGELGQRIPSPKSGDDLDDLVQSFNHMLDRVEQLVGEMRNSLDTVAHDLRTPMTRFRTNAETTLAGSPDAGALADALGGALEESDQILRMLNSIMDISEAQAGAMSLRIETLDLALLTGQVAEVYSIVAEEAGVSVETQLAPGVHVNADSSRLRQVIGNLVDNAVKYSRPDAGVNLTLGVADDFAELTVRNEGEGISDEELPNIWDRLYRGEAGKRSAGLGLGLTLVQAIVRAHGGTVDVNSVAGSFAEFRIRLPLANTAGERPAVTVVEDPER